MDKICIAPGCDKSTKDKGKLCPMHYYRMKHLGTLDQPIRSTLKRPLIERFMEKIEMIPESGCWIWMGSCGRGGYGVVCNSRGTMPRTNFAHRISWELFNGPIPTGLDVLHRCDTPACVNSNHLFLGTDIDNMRDRDSKGRHRTFKGEECGSSKLKEPQVIEIKKDNRPHKIIAQSYGVCKATISHIKNGRNWKHIKSGEETLTSKENKDESKS